MKDLLEVLTILRRQALQLLHEGDDHEWRLDDDRFWLGGPPPQRMLSEQLDRLIELGAEWDQGMEMWFLEP